MCWAPVHIYISSQNAYDCVMVKNWPIFLIYFIWSPFVNLLDFWKIQKFSEFVFLSALSGLNLKNYYNKGLKESTLENTRDKIWIRKKYQRLSRTESTWLRWCCRYISYIKNNIIIILLKILFHYRQ